jgi:hypothetical protein
VTDGELRRIFKEHLPRFDFQSVETWSTGQGVPDVNYCCDGVEGWIENKKSTSYTVGMRSEQVAWIERRRRAGGRVYIAVRRMQHAGARTVACDELWLWPGSAARALFTRELTMRGGGELGRWPGGPQRWPWALIAKILMNTKT